VLSFEDAREIAIRHAGPDVELLDQKTRETDSGWYFCPRVDEGVLGGCGFMVDRGSGRVFEFPSCFSVDENIARYEAGFRFERYDLRIVAVRDRRRTVELLQKVGLTYVVLEDSGGDVWRIPRRYSSSQLGDIIDGVPCVIRDQALFLKADVFRDIDESGCCTYEVLESGSTCA